MNSSSKKGELSLLKFKLLISNYQNHLLEQENQIFKDEIKYLDDTEVQLREHLHQQIKLHQLQVNHFNGLFK